MTSVEALIEEAQALWRAEDPAWLPSGLIGGRGGWGTVGVLANPEINEAVSLQWQWIERVRAGGLLVRTDRHVPLTDGAIEMAWPRSDVAGNSLEVCLILAAVNRVDPPPPTPFAIADAWIANSCRADSSEAGVIRSENYFFQNIANGLRTDDDGQIWARMCSKHAPFLGDDAYRAPVERLSREFGAPERFQRA